jgi:hypothetical protein
VTFLTEEIFDDLDSPNNIKNFYTKNKDNNDFDNAVNKINTFIFTNENNHGTKVINSGNGITPKEKKTNYMLIILVIINTILSISAVVLAIINFNKKSDNAKANSSNYYDKSNNTTQIDLFKLSEIIDNKIESTKLKQEFEKLRKEIDIINNFIKESQKIGIAFTQKDTVGDINKGQITSSQSDIKVVKYSNGCEADGGFKIQNLTDDLQHNSCYVITIINHNATFCVIESNNAFVAITQYPDDRLLPVCDVVRENSNGASKIKTLTPGNLILEGDTWKLKTKAKVSYE